jgi:hypothetical protein
MIEIRVRWLSGCHSSSDELPTDGGIWFPDTADNRRDLQIIVDAGNEFMGKGSHWLEEREA